MHQTKTIRKGGFLLYRKLRFHKVKKIVALRKSGGFCNR